MRQSKYSQEFKDSTVQLIINNNESVVKVAEDLDLNPKSAWKKNLPLGVDVSIESVKLLKCIFLEFNSLTSSIRLFTLLPNLSSFHTTKVSFSLSISTAFKRSGRYRYGIYN